MITCTLLGAAAGVAIGIGSLWWLAPFVVLPVAVLVPEARLPKALPAAAAGVCCTAVAAAVGALTYTDPGSGAVNSVIVALVAVALVFGGWAWRVARRLRHAELARGWELARALEGERDAALATAVGDERSAMAGQVHDRLGHRLNLATVRLGRLWLDRDLSAEQRSAIAAVRSELAEITDEIGTTVRLLSGGQPAPEYERDPASVLARARAAGCPVEADLTGIGQTSDLAQDTLGRVLEEAVANAARHAPGASIEVSTRRDATDVILIIGNSKIGGPMTLDRGAGTGLERLRERTEHVGGSLTVRQGEYFEVEARIPIEASLHTRPGVQGDIEPAAGRS